MKAGYLRSQGQALVCLAVFGFQAVLASAGEAAPTPWPRHIDTPQGRCTVFQPQPAVLDGDRLSARAALAVAPGESTNVVFGIAQLQARAARDLGGTQTTISEIVLTHASFAPANASAMAGLADALKPELAKVTWTVSADEIQGGLDAVERERVAARSINTAAPKILYSPKPAALVLLDGPPQLRAVTNSPLLRVVNTPYAMLVEPGEQRYWLQGSYEWFSATDWRGEWTPVPQPPAAVAAAVPPGAVTNAPALGSLTSVSPRIVVSTEPAELVVTRGEATYTPVAGSDLLYVSNSDQLLFFTIDTKEFYVAFSGRWYRSPALTGPWDPVTSDTLPPAFAKIAPGSPKSEALTYVAGTVEAQDAVLQANIPQITAVNRGPANVEVKYDGAPRLQPVDNTGVQYAANTADAVFLVRGNYYLCRDAVWYTGPGPDGPWSVATEVPSEIQSLPPSHPHYNVKYVYVYGSTPEEVYVGYVPSYSGCYVNGPTVVYGTGWGYPGYYGPSYGWAYPATFGFGFGYNSWSGWSVGVGLGYGWLSCGYGWGWSGCYPWGWWGPCGAYWACTPRYPHYDGHHNGGGGHGGDGGHGGHGGYASYGGQGGRGNQGGPPPSSYAGGMRSELRKDAPAPSDRPTNPQRRTLPSYARTAKASYQPSTGLSPARAIESRSGGGNSPSRLAPPTRTEAANGSNPTAPRISARQGGGASSPSRSEPGTAGGALANSGPRAAASQPGRSPANPWTSAPTRSAPTPMQAPSATQPGRAAATTPAVPTRATAPAIQRTPNPPGGSWPGARPNATAIRTPTPTASPVQRVATSPAPPVYARTPVSVSAPSRSWPGAAPSYAPSAPRSVARSPSFASAPVYAPGPSRSTMPSYGSVSRAPSMRAPMAAPSAAMRSSAPPSDTAPTRGGYSSGYSAPTRSAPTRSASGSSGGSMSRGGSSRGR